MEWSRWPEAFAPSRSDSPATMSWHMCELERTRRRDLLEGPDRSGSPSEEAATLDVAQEVLLVYSPLR
jgi:hypothetical protein